MEPEFSFDALYMVAVMQVQKELGAGRFDGFTAELERTLAELGIGAEQFDRYLARHHDDLRKMVEAVGV